MITDDQKQHYLAVKKINAVLKKRQVMVESVA